MEIDIEHKDWHEDDSWRQKLPTGNPFSVPAGYFEGLSERIISGVHLEGMKQADALGGFTVPEGYFDQLSINIQSRMAIEEAITAEGETFAVPENYFDNLSSNIQSRIVLEEALGQPDESFTVPQGYFDELTSNIQSRIAVEEALQEQPGSFTVPEGYFENLSSQIQSRIAIEELAHAESNAFAVPEGYFESLQQTILSQTAQKQEARVVAMQPREGVIRKLISTAAFKYASAACLAIIVGLAVYMKEGVAPSAARNHTFLHEQLQEVSTDALQNYLESHADATQTERTVIADGSQFDDDALKAALQDYVDAQ